MASRLPVPISSAVMGSPLPTPCVAAALEACTKFPVGTGLGWGRLNPRALLPRQAIVAMLRLFILAELSRAWAKAESSSKRSYHSLSDAGRRPIGIFPSQVPLWMRTRLPVAQAWQRDRERE
jgi:hypothetical protein